MARRTVLAAGVLVVALAAVAVPSAPAGAAVDQVTPAYSDRVVDRTYVVLFARRADAASRAYWLVRVIERPDATWFARALSDSAEYRSGLGRTTDAAFVDAVFRRAAQRSATSSEQHLWTTYLAGGGARATVVSWAVEHLFTYRLARPNRPTQPCSGYGRGGLRPVCERGSAGSQRDVAILLVPGTDLWVDKAWFGEVAGLVAEAKAAGYALSGERDPSLPSWFRSPGSWRTYDEQLYLYQHGFPANPPGRSLHEWGLAVDLDCNGHKITKVRTCWDWVRAHGPAHGVHLFGGATTITHPEASHFSSNGL